MNKNEVENYYKNEVSKLTIILLSFLNNYL
jgi:hypothetical protein